MGFASFHFFYSSYLIKYKLLKNPVSQKKISTEYGAEDTTVKAFVVTPKMTKNSIIFRAGNYKGYKIFIADKNLFVCILIYYNKNVHFQWITKKCKNYKIKFSLKYNLY